MPDLKTIPILVPGPLNPDTLAELKETFEVIEGHGAPVDGLPAETRERVRGVALAGRFTPADMEALPKLEIVAHFGVGYDGVPADEAARRGIMVTNTPDVLTDEVADTALALLLNTVREFPLAEQHLRAGQWKEAAYPLTERTLRGRRVGILGLGRIGLAIARRVEAFGLTVEYHNRSPRSDVAYSYHPTLLDLAKAVDTLIVVAPGGAETKGAVNAEVLAALGPDGVLVNVGRGTVVDEPALIAALRDGTIAAAGLDVFEREPQVPAELLALPNACLLPHVASASRATRRAMGRLVIDNLAAWFAGEALLSPVPETIGIANPNS
ncbi:2-hydroxyacid dehydrogenase [Aureimonas leprariae]|uniref:2-hydroxyacid dehydrogenase n=1 Tax=Plantimonas leprariae TaxID=2615207 RepID=A0A7V7PM79_9HYPH|nr:2-hydroxyacid dehydrogenase [Aureimonas leprariae]KAB0677990.1 2-hydroxyacid dehydrogenase [Aureimonas leprariae]